MPAQNRPCPECGAPPEDGERCDERFRELLAFDYSDPAYMSVHHLLVTTWQAQHAENIADGALAEYDDALVRHVRDTAHDPDGTGLRQWLSGRMGERFAGPTRVRSYRPVGRARPAWSRTVFDVDFADADAYRRTVSAWAASVGRDLSDWVGGDGPDDR